MSADSPAAVMREAAAKILADIALVPPSPWFAAVHDVTTRDGLDVIASSGLTVRAAYVAAWQPSVTVAVADWLTATAEEAEAALYEATTDDLCCGTPGACSGHPGMPTCGRCSEPYPDYCHCWDKALAVARAYLGGEQ